MALQLIELKTCSNLDELEKQLGNLPRDLDETYDRIISKIDERDHDDVKRFLQWLAFSARSLKLAELAEVVVVDFNSENGPQVKPRRRYKDHRDVLEKCSSLVIESEGAFTSRTPSISLLTYMIGIVKLAHFSVKEYLASEKILKGAAGPLHISEKLSHSLISQTCLVYLLHFSTDDSLDWTTTTSYPLALYAAEHWILHAQSADINNSSTIQKLILNLFRSDGASFNNWIRLWDVDRFWKKSDIGRSSIDIPAPIYYASSTGLQVTVQQLLESGADANVQGGRYGNALQAASYRGHEAIVKLLLEKGADVNAQGGEYGNALQAASYGGHEAIVKLLLEKGADVNAQGGPCGNALQAASLGGHEAIVKLLLEKGADVNAQGGVFGNALQAASSGGHEAIVKLLLEKGADVNAQGGYYGNALQAASYEGHEAIVKLLLEKGADVNAQGGVFGNALQAASYGGHEEAIVKLLLEKGRRCQCTGRISTATHCRWRPTEVTRQL